MLTNLQRMMETTSCMGRQPTNWIDLLNGVNTMTVVLLPQLKKALRDAVLQPLRALNSMRDELRRRVEQRAALWTEYEQARK